MRSNSVFERIGCAAAVVCLAALPAAAQQDVPVRDGGEDGALLRIEPVHSSEGSQL